MATVKGKYRYVWGDVEIKFTIHLLCDEGSSIATRLLREVGRIVQSFTDGRDYTFDDIVENRALIERVLLGSRFETGSTFASAPVDRFASQIDLEFTKIVEISLDRKSWFYRRCRNQSLGRWSRKLSSMNTPKRKRSPTR